MDAVKIPKAKLDMLRLLLTDQRIKNSVVGMGNANEILVTDEGNVLVGKSKYGWVNKIFNSYKEIDFFTVASKIAVMITTKNTISKHLVGLFDEIVNKTLVNNDREQVIDLLFQYIVLFDKDSIFASKFINLPESIKFGSVSVDFGGNTVEIPVTLDRHK